MTYFVGHRKGEPLTFFHEIFSRIDTDDIEKMCVHNSKIAATVGRKDLVKVDIAIKLLSFWTERPEQTVQTQI